jgi:hypothetical protein
MPQQHEAEAGTAIVKAKIVNDQDGRFYGVSILCPACAWPDGEPSSHTLETDWMPEGAERTHGARKDGFWSFDGNLHQPTFAPSLLCQSTRWDEASQQRVPHICHTFIRDGRIEFLSDCTHALAGQTVDLPELVNNHG